MNQLRSPIIWRLILWFLLLSLVPLGVMLVFIQRDVQTTMMEYVADDLAEVVDIMTSQIARQPDQMQVIVREFATDEQTPFVLNPDGTYAAYPEVSKVGQDARGDSLGAEEIEQILKNPGHSITLNDEPMIVHSKPGVNGLTVVIVEDTVRMSKALAGLTGQITFRLILSFAIVALVGGAAIMTILHPLTQLSTFANRLGAGELDAQLDSSEFEGEIATLANSLSDMAQSVKQSITSLDQRVLERTQALTTMSEISTATATILETDRILQSVVELTKERFGLYHSHIYLLDESGENLVLAAGAGEPGRIMAAEKRSIPLSRERSLVARAARERRGVTVNDVTREPDFLPNPLLPDTRSELAVPMLVGADLVGVFDIQSEQIGRFTDADIAVQTTLASQIATSIQNARSFERSKAQSELETQVNLIGQKIQRAATIEETLQTAIRELGTALGATRVSAKIGQILTAEVLQSDILE